MSLNDLFLKVLDAYPEAKNLQISEIADLIVTKIPNTLIALLQDNHTFTNWHSIFPKACHGSVGKGNWAAVPWVAILNPLITHSVSEGVYIVYLFCADGEGIYLTLAQGTGGIASAKVGGQIENMRKLLLDKIDAPYFKKGTLPQGSLNADNNPRPRAYEQSCILSKYYSNTELKQIPESNIISDLKRMIDIYAGCEDIILSNMKGSKPEFIEIMRRYKDEGTVFRSTVQGALYCISEADESRCEVLRIDTKTTVQVTNNLYKKKLKMVQENGGTYFFNENFDSTSAVRTAVLQALPFGITQDKKNILDLTDDEDAFNNFCDIIKNLRVNITNDQPTLYKPAILACVIEAIGRNKLSENKIIFDDIVPLFFEKTQTLGIQADKKNAAYGFFHLAGDLFWMHCYDDPYIANKNSPKTASDLKVQGIKYAIIKDTYWRILQNHVYREKVLSTLAEKWWPDETKNYWIFQGNPETYDLSNVMKKGLTTSWTVSRFKNTIKRGDQGFLWQSGENAGVIASFEVLKKPSKDIKDADVKGWKTDDTKDEQPRCMIRIKNIFPDVAVSRKELLNTDFGKEISIIRNANGTNFQISKEEFDKILNMIKPGGKKMDKILAHFEADLLKAKLHYSHNLLGRFVASCLSKRFVIMTGLSGSGKTKLAQSFSYWIAGNTKGKYTINRFSAGKIIESSRVKYEITATDSIAITLTQVDTKTKVTLPYELIDEWIDVIKNNNFNDATTPRIIRDEVAKTTKYSGQLNSFETHLKSAAFSLIKKPLKKRVGGSQVCLVPVGADWTNREPLLGYPNALEPGKYIKPENNVVDLLLEASKEENTNKPYFLILDEMNLSHVERYFADFLSAMESEEAITLHPGSNDWKDDDGKWKDGIPDKIKLSENLFIIGTVNIDETTYMFSPKVLDRANVIEFRVSDDEMIKFLQNPVKPHLESLMGAGTSMDADFVRISEEKVSEFENKEKINKTLIKFFTELKKTGSEFGYRSASEIFRFAAILNKLTEKEGEAWETDAVIDAAVMQKLLPKIHGSRKKLEPVLTTLAGLCLTGDMENTAEQLKKFEESPEIIGKDTGIRFKISLEKILRMRKRVVQDGFTSFAEA